MNEVTDFFIQKLEQPAAEKSKQDKGKMQERLLSLKQKVKNFDRDGRISGFNSERVSELFELYAATKILEPGLLNETKENLVDEKDYVKEIGGNEMKNIIGGHFKTADIITKINDLANLKAADYQASRQVKKDNNLYQMKEDAIVMFNGVLENGEWRKAAQIGADLVKIDTESSSALFANEEEAAEVFQKLSEGMEKPEQDNAMPDYLQFLADLKILFPDEFERHKNELFDEKTREAAHRIFGRLNEGNNDDITRTAKMRVNLKLINSAGEVNWGNVPRLRMFKKE